MLRTHLTAVFFIVAGFLTAPVSTCLYAGGARVPRLDLSGGDWMIHPDRREGAEQANAIIDAARAKGWLPATVPGNIQADIEASKLVKPFYYGAGDPLLGEIATVDWVYRKRFIVPDSFRGRRLTLVFDGVDQHCVVTLNGKELGSHAGMFERFGFDATGAVRFGERNELRVRVSGIPEDLAAIVAQADAKDGARVVATGKVVQERYRELKSAINNAYDWGVSIYTLGIWKDVRLEASGAARIEWVQVQTQLQDDFSKALLTVRVDLDSLENTRASLTFRINGHNADVSKALNAQLKSGTNVVSAELVLENPELWWPNGWGAQPLYELTVTVADPSTDGVLQSRTTRFGVREVDWERTEGAPQDFPNRFGLVLNGRRIRMMGSNIVPPDLLFGRIGDNGRRLIRLAAAAGFNKLRVWGGGIILPEAMYDLADEMGIMLFQEYPLANLVPEANPEFLANLEDTAVNIVKQLRNHPCLIEWSGGNEMPWPDPHHPALEVLRRATGQYDDRVFRDTCAIAGGGAHWPYIFHPKENPPSGWGFGPGVNFYQGWNSKEGMRFGEFAANSPANLEVWQREILPESKWPINDIENPILVRKNVYHAAGGDSWLHKEHLEKYFGVFESIQELVEAGQFFGAEGLRYAMDELRRRGKRVGGFTSWDYNEPWPNGAGSYMIDYDGRPLMNYDFVKQALAPVAMSIRQDGMFFDLGSGFECSLWMVSDAPAPVSDLHWSWKARDRRGTVFARNNGTASIDPIEVKPLDTLHLQAPQETALGPVFVELQLCDGSGRLLTERIHVFGADGLSSPLRGLICNRGEDADDHAEAHGDDPRENLALAANGAKPATASSSRPEAFHQPAGINDGLYGNAHSWIGAERGSSLEIDLGRIARIGEFRSSRDRRWAYSDRPTDYMKIEVSRDGGRWSTVFNQRGLVARPGFSPNVAMIIRVAPVEARYVRVTVDSPAGDSVACIDEFEVYAPVAADAQEGVSFDGRRPMWRPVRRTRLELASSAPRVEDGREVLELALQNTGEMTALFCEAHPLVDYRTDLFIDNNHGFIPPHERRTIRIESDRGAESLSLDQTGWRISCWNADDVVVEPGENVLLSVGRRDRMCREFAGYAAPSRLAGAVKVRVAGRRPDASRVPYLCKGNGGVTFVFELNREHANRPARLRIHTADQSAATAPKVLATVNGRSFEGSLPSGLGIQQTDPAHLALAATVEFPIAAGVLHSGENILEVGVDAGGWFTWDALDVIGGTTGAVNAGVSGPAAAVRADVEPPLRPYRAKWIWSAVKHTAPFQYVRFRKRFELDEDVSNATAFVTADTFYRLWVNGNLAMHGPARSSEGTVTIDPVPIAAWLKPGTNTVEAEAMYYDGRFEALGQSPGFLCELELSVGDARRVIATDGSWESREDLAWSRQSPKFSYQRTFIEDVDARKLDDSPWGPARVLGPAGMAPWTTITMRDIPLPDPQRTATPASVVSVQRGDNFIGELKGTPELESTRYGPRPEWCKRLQTERVSSDDSAAMNPRGVTAAGSGDTVLVGDGASIVYDLGVNRVGFFAFEVSGNANQTIEMAWNESLDESGRCVRPIQGIEATQALRYRLREGRQRYVAFNPHLARYLRIVQRGGGRLALHRLWLIDHSFALPATGTFQCSDDGLNRVYAAAVRTARLNTLDTFMDNPDRERGSWMREGYWMAQAVHCAFGDLSVSRRMVRYGADSQNAAGRVGPPGMVQMLCPATNFEGSFIPAHALYWALQAGLHARIAGDATFVRETMPAVRRLMDAFTTWRNPEGLLENVESWNFLDWADLRTDGVSVGLNAIYARTLDEAARMERAIGEDARAARYREEAEGVRRALRGRCTAALFFPDALVRDGEGQLVPAPQVCEATQYFVLWSAVPSAERAVRMWNALRDDYRPTPGNDKPVKGLTRGGLYSFFERLQVAARFGDHEGMIRDVKTMFQPMADSSPGTLWEHPQRQWCLCQGFASGVAAILTEEVLGIRMDRHLRINPHGGGRLAWCRGGVTTPCGRVEVAWKLAKDRYELNVSLPAGETAEVVLPPEAEAIWRTGRPAGAWQGVMQVSGEKRITITQGAIR